MPETETDRAQAAREKQLHTLDRLAKGFGQSLTQALGGPLGAGRQLDGLLGTLTTKLSSLALKAALAPVKTGITGLVKGALSAAVAGGTETFARGGVVARGRVQPFAAGGIVAAPTYFPMRGGHGLMGEAGPEAILPLKRGSDGRLGVAAGAEARGPSVTVHITTPDIAGFRRSEAQVAAGLARAVARGRRGL
ncbi:phage tail tape measure protein [Methylobacterium sp. WL69]|uniref:phage tail tape measure protein n=1 Tax=Methylobacterium sp. WL69 TaxID=2603893 RepID=UPI0011CAED4E|nr:phage tail tape measure protein [Methylobacterium sp. WL69]TXM67523.1 phage tail tape measure protein [Methylobacterium sp. WL69]